ncbi:MAG: hypothetical protein QXM52_00975 [Candidatus Bathyarchaeia archaeon]
MNFLFFGKREPSLRENGWVGTDDPVIDDSSLRGARADETFRLLRQLKEMVDPISAVSYRRKKLGIVAFKYLRKFVNDAITSEELNISESVADFI